ncbi:hypothetical protein [Cellulomonas sp. P5_C6]
MTSWRDTTPADVQDDLDGVVGAALDAAQDLLAKNGEFFPFVITLDNDGALALAAGDPGLGERPESLAVLAHLYAGAAQERADHRAFGFVADILSDGADAVRVEVEHRDGGPALAVVAPYVRKGLIRKTVTYTGMGLEPGERRIWS